MAEFKAQWMKWMGASVDQAELGDIEKAARSAYARGLSSVPPLRFGV